jgi:DUF4097 and DUF4098 domain-containing protein YvlB
VPTHHFETHHPVALHVEIGRGDVTVHCVETTETSVVLDGSGASDVLVEQDGDAVRVVEPRRTGLFRTSSVNAVVTVPFDSDVTVRTSSADVVVDGRAGDLQVRSGSGDVALADATGRVHVETGSGDVRIGSIAGAGRLKSGSGDLAVDRAGGDLAVSTGTGDVTIAASYGATQVKTGTGDLDLRQAHGDVAMTTGNGDLSVGQVHRGRITVRGASGDVRVGITRDVPVWTDISTVTGDISSDLRGAGEPTEGQDHIEVRARTVSGDIALFEVGS